MRHVILEKTEKYFKQQYRKEDELTDIFRKYHKEIISPKSFWIETEKKLKSKNFKDSICDGFLLVWENTTTPLLYITEMELESHPNYKHILPQLGNFISFIKHAERDDVKEVKHLYIMK